MALYLDSSATTTTVTMLGLSSVPTTHPAISCPGCDMQPKKMCRLPNHSEGSAEPDYESTVTTVTWPRQLPAIQPPTLQLAKHCSQSQPDRSTSCHTRTNLSCGSADQTLTLSTALKLFICYEGQITELKFSTMQNYKIHLYGDSQHF